MLFAHVDGCRRVQVEMLVVLVVLVAVAVEEKDLMAKRSSCRLEMAGTWMLQLRC